MSYHLPGSLSSTQEIVDFQITHIVPSPACLCVNTDLEVDIQPTDEALAREAVERSMNAQKIPGSGAQAVSGTRLSWTEKDGNWICHVDPTSDLSMNETRVYALPTLSAPLTHYKVTVTPIASTSSSASADPDINVFISLTHDAPDLLHHHFLNVDHGVSNLYFRLTDPLPPVLYLGIQGASDVPSQFALDAQVSVNSFEQPQSSITTPTLDVDTERPVDSELCSNCQTWIPSRTIVMHRAFCERNNAKCDKCGRVMKRVDAATHWHCSVYDCDKVNIF